MNTTYIAVILETAEMSALRKLHPLSQMPSGAGLLCEMLPTLS